MLHKGSIPVVSIVYSSFCRLPYRILIIFLVKPKKRNYTMETIGIGVRDFGVCRHDKTGPALGFQDTFSSKHVLLVCMCNI